MQKKIIVNRNKYNPISDSESDVHRTHKQWSVVAFRTGEKT